MSSTKPEGEMQIFEKETIPFQTIHIDFFGPLEQTMDRFRHILVVIDAFTKFVWLFPTKSTSSEDSIKQLTFLFNLFGNPRRIISDRGTAFTSNSFSEFVNNRKIEHTLTAVASPWANGQVERVNRFLKSTLAKITEKSMDWKDKLGSVQYIINNTLNKSINSTPSTVLLGYDQRDRCDNDLRALIDNLSEQEVNCETERSEARDSAQLVNRKLQEYNKRQYDKRHKRNTLYKKGDLVLIKIMQHKPGTNAKLIPKFKGPYQVKKVLKKNRYVITNIPGCSLTQKALNTILSSDKLKLWIREVKEPRKYNDVEDEANGNTANSDCESE